MRLFLFSRPIDAGSSWTKVNVDQLGYYRVNYPEEDWQSFAEMVLDSDARADLTISDITGLINDAFRY